MKHRRVLPWVVVVACLTHLDLAAAAGPERSKSGEEASQKKGPEHGRGAAKRARGPKERAARAAATRRGGPRAGDPAKHRAKGLERASDRLEHQAERVEARAAALRESGSDDPELAKKLEKMDERARRLEEKAAKLDAKAKAKPANAEVLEERKRLRQERRQARRAWLRQRWGKSLRGGDAQSELSAHAQRVAKLERIRVLAVKAKKTKVVARVDRLLAREQQRHETRMQEIAQASAAEPETSPAAGVNAPASADEHEEEEG